MRVMVFKRQRGNNMYKPFVKAMSEAGIIPETTIIADGKLHRFHIRGDKQGSLNGWYVLSDVDGFVSGSFGSWKTGQKENWRSKTSRSHSAMECKQLKKRVDEARKERQIQEDCQKNEARKKALFVWNASCLARNTHPYLLKKRVCNHGLREYKGSLVVPLMDSFGVLHSLQFIDSDGNKFFLSGGRKSGCYFTIGSPHDRLCVAEGYATAASIYEATGSAVAVAFDAGNLELVAVALREKFPEIKLTVCADNDENTFGNPGLTKARKAAIAARALLSIPPIAGDFNDLYTGNFDHA